MRKVLIPLLIFFLCGCAAERLNEGGAVMDKYARVAESAERQEQAREVDGRLKWLLEATGASTAAQLAEIRTANWRAIDHMRLAQGLTHRPATWCDPAQAEEESCRTGPGDDGGPGPGDGGGGGGDPAPCAWTSTGPTNIPGRIQSLAIDPLNGSRLYAATVGGLWRTANAGRTWERVTDDMQADGWSAIAARGTRVIAARGDANYDSGAAGIWTSTNRGATGSWADTAPPSPLNTSVVYRLRLDGTGSNVFAATSTGLWTADLSAAAISWTRLGGMDANVDDFAADWSGTAPIFYVAVKAASATYAVGIWRWDGTSWTSRSDGFPTASISRIALALAQSAPSTLYARVVQSNGRQMGIYKTTTAGVASGSSPGWSALTGAGPVDDAVWPDGSGNGYSWYVNVIEVDPADANRVYAGGVGIYRTTNGNNFNSVSSGAETGWTYGVHSDQHTIAFDPGNPKIVWLGNDGGADRSSDTTMSVWRWEDRSHGMVSTEFYRITGQSSIAGLRAGGSQDNGTEITFGNRTWYQPGGCDGSTVAIDAGSAVTLYANCNGTLNEKTNPIPGWMGGPLNATWTSPRTPRDPLMADPGLAGRALASSDQAKDAMGTVTGPRILLKTTDGLAWTQANSTNALTSNNQAIRTISIAASSSFQTWYVGLSNPRAVWRTDSGSSGPWTTGTGISSGTVNDIEVDRSNPQHAYLALGGGTSPGVWQTTNGTAWTQLVGSGVTAWPSGVSATAIAIDPADSNTVYAATPGGVLRGTGANSTTGVAWSPYDDGLPDGVTATDLWINPATGVLTMGTMGYGSWLRATAEGAACPARMLLVRDNVYDLGFGPAPDGAPDPEHPIPDPARSGFFKPDDTAAGRLYWWMSTDVRIDVPSAAAVANTIANADHVEAETCPIEMTSCPAGTIHDTNPVRGALANVYAQVNNPGTDPVQNTRMIALYADATSGLPDLPPNFWSTTFPSGGTACGALSGGSGWSLVDPSNPCRNVSVTNPLVPEVRKFAWNVPTSQAEHTCLLVITDSPDDPLDPSVRASDERRVWKLVPENRQIANRNLHVVDASSTGSGSGSASGGGGWPRSVDEEPALTISTVGLPKGTRLGLLLPQGRSASGLDRQPFTPDDRVQREAASMGLDASTIWMFSRVETDITGLFASRGEQVPFLLVWSGLNGPAGSSWRITAMEKSGGTVIGGQVWVIRLN